MSLNSSVDGAVYLFVSLFVACLQGHTVSQGSILGETKDEDTTPAIDGTSGSLEVDAIEDNDREKRGVGGFIDKVNGMSMARTLLMCQ